MSETIVSQTSIEKAKKAHPWRICPMGKHFVREHIVHTLPSKKHPEGATSTWHQHCANNPSHKDELSYHEIQYITETFFGELVGPPTAGLLTKEFSNADNYDTKIRGWVKYWNDVLQPDELLDPNLVKALIGTESSFRENPPGTPKAHGLMQILNNTFLILQNPKGELTDYLIHVPRNEISNPSVNICMGIRWLFQKKKLASIRLKRSATWIEAIIEYKSYWDDIKAGKDPKGMQLLHQFYQILQEE